MAHAIGFLSLPVGIFAAFYFGRAAYRGEIQQWAVALMVGIPAGLGVANTLLDFAKWLDPSLGHN